mgnify:CR=1 FL=1
MTLKEIRDFALASSDRSPVELARIRNVSVIRSSFDTLNTALRIKSWQFIDPVVDTEFVTVAGKASVAEARGIVEQEAQRAGMHDGQDRFLAGPAVDQADMRFHVTEVHPVGAAGVAHRVLGGGGMFVHRTEDCRQ